MPGPALFAVFGLIHAALAVAALATVPLALALPYALVEVVTAYDSAVVVLGHRIGVGPHALPPNRLRFFLHAVVIGLLVPVYVGIGSALDVPVMAGPWALSAAYWFAAAIALFGYTQQYRRLGVLMPTLYYGCLRYAQAVDEPRRYSGYDYSAAELTQRAVPPLASIVTVLLGLLLSFWVGWQAGFWWPFAVTLLMFSAAAFPARSWGPLLTSMFEIVFSAGLLWSLWRVIA